MYNQTSSDHEGWPAAHTVEIVETHSENTIEHVVFTHCNKSCNPMASAHQESSRASSLRARLSSIALLPKEGSGAEGGGEGR